jgi:dipeptidyl aminopeptidase/acylaminoacyl peptidase
MTIDQFELARAAMLAGQPAQAQALLKQVIRHNPQHGEAWYLLAKTLDDPGQRADCESRARAAGFSPPLAESLAQPRLASKPAAPPADGPGFAYTHTSRAIPAPPTRSPGKSLLPLVGGLGLIVVLALAWAGYRQFRGGSTPPRTDQAGAALEAPATRLPRPTHVPTTPTIVPTRPPVATPTLPQIAPVTVTPAAALPPANDAPRNFQGRIAYGKTGQMGQIDLYIADADGSNPRQLTDLLGMETSPAWSQDGTKIAFIASVDSRDPTDCYSGYVQFKCNFEIYSINVDGTDLRRVTNSEGYEREPSWSPDGTRIVYQSSRNVPSGSFWQLYVINADGTNEVQLTDEAAGFRLAYWSPINNSIVFTRVDDQDSDIYVMDVDERIMTRLTANNRVNYWPIWSYDGTQIAFLSYDETSDSALYVMNADGSGERLVDSGYPIIDGYRPAWSPDGTEIAFVSDRTGTFAIYAVDLATNTVRPITPSDARYSAPAWSPR